MSTKTTKLCDDCALVECWNGHKCLCKCFAKFFDGCVYVVFVKTVCCSWANQDVAVSSWCNQDTLTHLCGLLEQRVVSKVTNGFVHQHVVALARLNLILAFADEVVDFVCKQTCCVNNNFCLFGVAICTSNCKDAIFLFETCYFAQETEFNTVCASVFCIGNSHFVWGNNTATWDNQRCNNALGKMWFHFARFVAINNVKSLYTVLFATSKQVVQTTLEIFVEAKNHGTISTEWEVQFLGELVEHCVTLNVVVRFFAIGICVMATVYDTAVCFCGTYGYIVALFKQQDICAKAR